MKNRTRARQLALQFLYQIDLLGADKFAELNEFLQEEEGNSQTRRFAARIVKGTFGLRDELDVTIQEVAQNWQITRMAVIDRNVLRLAAYELLHCEDIPPNVAINEAIELGKRFSTANSGAFINGILDKIKNRAGEDADAGAEADTEAGTESDSDTEASAEADTESTPQAEQDDTLVASTVPEETVLGDENAADEPPVPTEADESK